MRVEPLDNSLVEFNRLSVGDCFISHEEAYIKIEPLYDYEFCENANAICLNDGMSNYFHSDEMVIPITAKLVIEPKGEVVGGE